ncbi:MAG: hypothetical protein KC492_16150 [Myxococcales bacterium]|nr:hypothetical protein [Myxococcales bacterium]
MSKTSEPTETSLDIAGRAIEGADIQELLLTIGRHQGLDMISAMGSLMAAQLAKRLKSTKEYKRLGFDWEEFCSRYLGKSRQQVDLSIKNLEEFGSIYFNLSEVVKVSPQTYRAIEGSINEEGAIEFGGEAVKIEKANAARVREIVEHLRKEAEKERQRATDLKHDAKEAREQRDQARKAEKREKERFDDYLKQQSGLYPHLTPNQRTLREVDMLLESQCQRLRKVKNSDELTEAERSELKGRWGLILDQICDATGVYLDPMQMELVEDAKTLMANAQ